MEIFSLSFPLSLHQFLSSVGQARAEGRGSRNKTLADCSRSGGWTMDGNYIESQYCYDLHRHLHT